MRGVERRRKRQFCGLVVARVITKFAVQGALQHAKRFASLGHSGKRCIRGSQIKRVPFDKRLP